MAFTALTDGWQWEDESAVEYTNWAENEPNGEEAEECVEMYPQEGTWNDISCDDQKGFICKAQRGKLLLTVSVAAA